MSDDEAIVLIRALPIEARALLSHVVRNGICRILSAHKNGGDVERELYEFESRWRELE